MKRVRKVYGKNASGLKYTITLEIEAPAKYPRRETIHIADIGATQLMGALGSFSGILMSKMKVKG